MQPKYFDDMIYVGKKFDDTSKNIDVFYMKIWQILNKPTIDNFGEKYANELN
jgi:hypothetical protein